MSALPPAVPASEVFAPLPPYFEEAVDTQVEGLELDAFDARLNPAPAMPLPLGARGRELARVFATTLREEIGRPIYVKIDGALETMAEVRSARPLFFMGAAATWQLASALALAAFLAGLAFGTSDDGLRKSFPKVPAISVPAAQVAIERVIAPAALEAPEAAAAQAGEPSVETTDEDPTAIGAGTHPRPAATSSRRSRRRGARARRAARARRSRR